MKVSLEELNPRPAVLHINGIAREFKPFDLNAKVWAKYEFQTDDEPNGLYNLQALFRIMDVEACVKVLYYLLADKRDFPTEKSFYLAVNKRTPDKLFLTLSTVFGLSEPQIKEAEKEALAKKVKAAGSSNQTI